MKQTHKQWAALAGVVAAVAGGTTAHAQSADALIDKLVDKGILTPNEARDLRDEVDKDFTRAYQSKSGLADWVTSLQINGDFRGRIEHFNATGDNTDDVFKDRTRFRYRLRLGVVANLFDNFEAGLRLSSSEPASGGPAGGDPISGNTTMQDNGSRKFIYVDLAYGKWTMLNNSALFSALSVGKIANPFVFSDMVFDGDYNPEGFGEQLAFHISDQHDLKLNLGLFSLDEIGADSDDPFMAGAQIRFDSKWSPHLITSAGVGMLGIANDEALDSSAAGVWTVPNQNGGNTRVTAPDAPPGRINQLAYNFNPIIADVAITYNLEKFFKYNTLFPITFAGDVMYNPAAPNEAGNKAFSVGVTFGKAGKKGLWEVGYRYKYLGANSWWEEVVDSDFGAFYQTALPGGGSGYVAGTNVRGHIVSAGYSPADAFTFNVKYFATQLIRENPPESNSDMGRLQVDANWKF